MGKDGPDNDECSFSAYKTPFASYESAGLGQDNQHSFRPRLVASPYKSAYVAAKHGLVGLTKAVALETGPFGVTVNAICPAYVRTGLVQSQIADQAKILDISEDRVVDEVMLGPASIKRLIEPSEVAEMVNFLISDAASSVTGTATTMDLGWTAR